jgi:hypothetical protein
MGPQHEAYVYLLAHRIIINHRAKKPTTTIGLSSLAEIELALAPRGASSKVHIQSDHGHRSKRAYLRVSDSVIPTLPRR